MERTVLERIRTLKGAIERMDDISVVAKETDAIFSEIDKLEGEEKRKAMNAMANIAIDMLKDIDSSPLMELLGMLERVRESKREVTEVNIKVTQYKDVTLVKIDKKIPYSRLLNILSEVRGGFEESVEHLMGAGLDDDFTLTLEYDTFEIKDIVIDMSEWGISKEVAEVYSEGFVEYLDK